MAEILSYVKDRVGSIIINREDKLNSLNSEVLTGMLDLLNEWELNPQVSLITITGAGKAFCTGADLSGLKNMAAAMVETKKFADVVKKIKGHTKPTVAIVNGTCMGGGIGLMLACDISIASDQALFSTPEVNVGLFPLIISTLIYKNTRSEKQANDFMFTGRKISTAEAYEMGMISQVIPHSEFEAQVAQYLTQLSQKSAQVLGHGKMSLSRVQHLSFEQASDELCKDLGALLQKEDAQEGVMAFMQKRKPNFKY